MRQVLLVVTLLFYCVMVQTISPFTLPAYAGKLSSGSFKTKLSSIDGIVKKSLNSQKILGAVVLIGNKDSIIYHRAFGYRSVLPKKIPMTADTIFDLASLTKVIATTTAVMQLVEQGKMKLEDKVSAHWPEFSSNGKEDITVRELLTHYSGLRADLDVNSKWTGYDSAIEKIPGEKIVSPPGAKFIYSDINFIILGELVRRISGQTLDIYCERHIFKPLGMKDTLFRPPASLHKRIAQIRERKSSARKNILGEVHDPTAYRMNGVAGHAGLFSTSDDLSLFAKMMLSDGRYKGVQILRSRAVEIMTTPQSPVEKSVVRGLGWDIDSPFSECMGDLFPYGTYGHTGYSGASILIDPFSETYVIILANRNFAVSKGGIESLRSQVATRVAAALGYTHHGRVKFASWSHENLKNKSTGGTEGRQVQTGIDVLREEQFTSLSGLRIGLITNHSGIAADGTSTRDLLFRAENLKLKAIFTPEHGLYGTNDNDIPSGIEPSTGLPLYSLYGKVKQPTDDMLEGLDALVFDIQDAGVRFFTYITTMGYAMESAAKKGIPFYVLDRPNPINASIVQGPVMQGSLKSFTGYFPMPLRHGMTVGELAALFNGENRIGSKLHVVKMRGYKRSDWFDETGLRWIRPSPNLRTLNEAVLYPGIAMVEGANVSVGRGTDTPFELLGAPWISNAGELTSYLNSRKMHGVKFMQADFIPDSNRFANQMCHGLKIMIADRESLDPTEMGIEIAAALYTLYPNDFHIDKTLPLMGAQWIVDFIKEGKDPKSIVRNWQESLEEFRKTRGKYLLY